jgi:putative SOS response-associated peptidase YedK
MLTCAILTRAAESPATDVHDRMPVIQSGETQSAWLDPKQTDSKEALAQAQEKPVTAAEHHPVATRVNNAKNQRAELIEPIDNPASPGRNGSVRKLSRCPQEPMSVPDRRAMT